MPESQLARLLLDAARTLGETLDPQRVYERFQELLAQAVQHDGVVVSSFDEASGTITCEYAWVEGNRLDPAIFPPLRFNERGGMQSQVIRTGEPLLTNEVAERVKQPGVYYNVDSSGAFRKLPEEGEPGSKAAMMVPFKHEGRVVGIVQVMSDRGPYGAGDLELVQALVGQMGAAVRNARLYAERARAEAAEAAARAIAQEREQAARVLEAVGDGIALVDDEGAIRFWNAAAEAITGVRREDAVARAELLAGWKAVLGQVPVAEGAAAARQVTLPVDVAERELWLSFVAVGTADGVVYAFRDLTLERRLEQAKSDFIATVSHELRTPMTAVLGAARTLLREDVAVDADLSRRLLEMIASEATRLGHVTEDVLLATSLDRGDLRVTREPVDVAAVVEDAVAALRPQLPPDVEIELAAERALASADRDRLRQVIVNLLDNAVKYSPDGGAVGVSVARAGDTVRLSVTDRGIGIAAAEHGRIFEKFYRSDPGLSRSPGGTGLGLYITRELVERMGGTITVESQPGSGSTFTCVLRAAR